MRRASVRLADAAVRSGVIPRLSSLGRIRCHGTGQRLSIAQRAMKSGRASPPDWKAMGLDARYLIDGFAGWHGACRPTRSLSS